MAVVSPHIIFQPVTVIFKSRRQVGRHEKTFVECVHILRTAHSGEVGRLSVCFQRIVAGTIITVTIRIGCRGKNT